LVIWFNENYQKRQQKLLNKITHLKQEGQNIQTKNNMEEFAVEMCFERNLYQNNLHF